VVVIFVNTNIKMFLKSQEIMDYILFNVMIIIALYG